MNDNAAGQGPLERPVRRDTLCWRCSTAYSETCGHCPKCGATNANVDYKAALVEMNQDRQDAERGA